MTASLPRALFVAREPDETLRTYLPVLRLLAERGRCAPLVLFHHTPGAWAQAELTAAGVPWREVALPEPPALLRRAGRAGATAAELAQLRVVRALAERVIRGTQPAVLIVIQDTLLLERFLVRAANRCAVPTLVVQWAFSYPQAFYDRFHARPDSGARAGARRVLGTATARGYRAIQSALGVRFDLANTYGGGEAAHMALMGAAFEQQFRAQGARKHAFHVSGHPAHDLAFRRAQAWTEQDRAETLRSLGLPAASRLVVYATQPTLWRGVLDREQLQAMVEIVADAVAAQGEGYRLVVKLHPREHAADYAFLAGRQGVVVTQDADVQRLIAACDAFVASSSSTLLYAMMFRKPIVSINFHSVPHFDVFAEIGGTLHVREPGSFAAALSAALHDPDTHAQLAAAQQAVLDRYTRFDGQATARLADMIEGWALGGGRA